MLWNDVPDRIKCANTVAGFKNILIQKGILIDQIRLCIHE